MQYRCKTGWVCGKARHFQGLSIRVQQCCPAHPAVPQNVSLSGGATKRLFRRREIVPLSTHSRTQIKAVKTDIPAQADRSPDKLAIICWVILWVCNKLGSDVFKVNDCRLHCDNSAKDKQTSVLNLDIVLRRVKSVPLDAVGAVCFGRKDRQDVMQETF
jgi:hypothetical protein